MNRKQRRAARTRSIHVARATGDGSVLRFSTIMRSLRRKGQDASADALEEMRVNVAHCEKHGELVDPVVFTMARDAALKLAAGGTPRHDVAAGDDGVAPFVIMGCPWCSDENIRAQWEREGMAS